MQVCAVSSTSTQQTTPISARRAHRAQPQPQQTTLSVRSIRKTDYLHARFVYSCSLSQPNTLWPLWANYLIAVKVKKKKKNFFCCSAVNSVSQQRHPSTPCSPPVSLDGPSSESIRKSLSIFYPPWSDGSTAPWDYDTMTVEHSSLFFNLLFLHICQ